MTFQDLLLAAIQRAEIPLRFEPGAEEAVANGGLPLAARGVRPGHFTSAEYYAVPGEDLRTYPVYRAYRQDCSGAISRNCRAKYFAGKRTFLLCADTQIIFLTIRLS